jgi:hypothetical protein
MKLKLLFVNTSLDTKNIDYCQTRHSEIGHFVPLREEGGDNHQQGAHCTLLSCWEGIYICTAWPGEGASILSLPRQSKCTLGEGGGGGCTLPWRNSQHTALKRHLRPSGTRGEDQSIPTGRYVSCRGRGVICSLGGGGGTAANVHRVIHKTNKYNKIWAKP